MGGSFLFLKLFQWGNPQETTDWNAKMLPPQLSSLAIRITVRSVICRITASDDSCVRGGLHGYKDTGHAREKPNLPICTCGDLRTSLIKKKKKNLRFLLYLMRPGLRNNEFTYHGLTTENEEKIVM